MAYFFIRNEEVHNRKIQRRQIRDFANPFELPDREFQANYRINKDMALYLCQELESTLAPQQEHGLPVHIKVCINIINFAPLRPTAGAKNILVLTSVGYMAAGCYQRKIGQDHNLSIAQTTVSKYFTQVVLAINQTLKPRWIFFPATETARGRVAAGFQQKFGLPNILGAIDCTHVTIFPPPRPGGLQYINRRGKHTINVQLIADVDCRLLNVNAQYPGKVHDQFIFNNSVIKTELRRLYSNRIGEYYLLGDSGYGLEPWMMTPILHAEPGSPEDRYTQWHCQARNTIERTNGYLKGSLRCLGIDQNLHYSPEKACSIIYACCTLYNIMKYFGVELEAVPGDEELNEDEEDYLPHQLFQAAILKRNQIVRRFFS